jgi:hypothetical protein
MSRATRTNPAPAVAFLHGGSHSHLATLADPALAPYRMRAVHVRTGVPEDIAGSDVVVVADRLRPDLLSGWAAEVKDALERGVTVVVFGENHVQDWLGVPEQPRPTIFWWWRTGEDHRVRLQAPDHPAWGFLFVDETNHRGRLLVTTMDPVYHHGSGFMPGATQLLYSALHWATRG